MSKWTCTRCSAINPDCSSICHNCAGISVTISKVTRGLLLPLDEPDTLTLPASVVREVAEALKRSRTPCDYCGMGNGKWVCGKCAAVRNALALLESHLPKESK
jgi:hypothetical protein